ncbi:MAG: signal peptidase II [Cyanobacteria bacterium J06560_2]
MKLKNPLFWIVTIIGVILDQLTKYWVVQNFGVGESVTIIEGVLNFTHIKNPGAAWSLFSENGDWLKWLSMLVSAGLALYGWLVRMPNRWEAIGYGFILSGAFGNGIDRLLMGEVVDFLQVFPVTRFPVFNLADIWINVGIFCLLVLAIIAPEEQSDRQREKRSRPRD